MIDFLKTHVYHNIKAKGEIASSDESAAKEFLQKLAQVLEVEDYIPDQALNADENVWIAPPDHPGISRKSRGGASEFDGNRKDQTAVSRLLSGHLKGMTFESGRKVFQTCSKCHLLPASPDHILDCLGLALEDVHASPLLVLDFARVKGLMVPI
ncbi:uncharacterized protein TNIN_288331 [Trichonephila inaurata madagascariensis]|uniref:Uncharacterized protein n=1 Tax=Trichonephila inaurata madagascariensis TaxID=2747483 RepID=A0A8X6YAR2_9ARAC|nr:uncharacterized protein TNIN_288331 [Trichonephila inaurata madagascariensis]